MLKKYFDRLEYLDYLIRKKGIGSPKILAKRLQISERSVYTYIELLKSLGAPINYSKERMTYYYELEGNINFKFTQKKIN